MAIVVALILILLVIGFAAFILAKLFPKTPDSPAERSEQGPAVDEVESETTRAGATPRARPSPGARAGAP